MKVQSSASASLQKLILENVSDIIITTDLSFIIESWNHIAEQFYGIPASEAIGQPINYVVEFDFQETTAEQAFRELALAKIWKGEVSYTNKQGDKFFFLQTVQYAFDEAG